MIVSHADIDTSTIVMIVQRWLEAMGYINGVRKEVEASSIALGSAAERAPKHHMSP